MRYLYSKHPKTLPLKDDLSHLIIVEEHLYVMRPSRCSQKRYLKQSLPWRRWIRMPNLQKLIHP